MTGALRALPIGRVLTHDQAERRRKVKITMSQATHADPGRPGRGVRDRRLRLVGT